MLHAAANQQDDPGAGCAPGAVDVVVKCLRDSGFIRSCEPDWAVRELAEDILLCLSRPSGTVGAPPTAIAEAH